MRISKTIPVALATVFTLTTVGAGFAVAAPSGPGKPHAASEKVQTANYRHHGGGKGKKHMRGHGGHRDGRGGLDRLIEGFDADGDGGVTQEEIISTRTTRLSEFDTNKDGSLDLNEYQALWLDAMRERMVDQFQAHDDDGDGIVTVEEFTERFTKIVERRDRNGDGVLNSDDTKRPERKGPGEPEGR
jgi:hypothetical protein